MTTGVNKPGKNHKLQALRMSSEKRISSRAKQNDLYPILQHIAMSVRSCKLQVESIDTRTKKIEHDLSTILSIQRELHELIKDNNKKSWNVKDAGFDVSCAGTYLLIHIIVC